MHRIDHLLLVKRATDIKAAYRSVAIAKRKVDSSPGLARLHHAGVSAGALMQGRSPIRRLSTSNALSIRKHCFSARRILDSRSYASMSPSQRLVLFYITFSFPSLGRRISIFRLQRGLLAYLLVCTFACSMERR
jgi:hypothetical protein